jgi:hypothetical protein
MPGHYTDEEFKKLRREHKAVRMAKIPNCDINPQHGPAYADAAIHIQLRTTWANVCKGCFDLYGGKLGLGAGQELILREEPTKGPEN